jgi:hypothetical protein
MLSCAKLAVPAAFALGMVSCSGSACDPRLPFKLEGKLVHGNGSSVNDSKIYIVVGGEKRWITRWEWITAHGFTNSDVLTRPSAELACIPEGDRLP